MDKLIVSNSCNQKKIVRIYGKDVHGIYQEEAIELCGDKPISSKFTYVKMVSPEEYEQNRSV